MSTSANKHYSSDQEFKNDNVKKGKPIYKSICMFHSDEPWHLAYLSPLKFTEFISLLMLFILIIYLTCLPIPELRDITTGYLIAISTAYLYVYIVYIIAYFGGHHLPEIPLIWLNVIGALLFITGGWVIVYSAPTRSWARLLTFSLCFMIGVLHTLDFLLTLSHWRKKYSALSKCHPIDLTQSSIPTILPKPEYGYPPGYPPGYPFPLNRSQFDPRKCDVTTSISGGTLLDTMDDSAFEAHATSSRKVFAPNRRQYSDRKSSLPELSISTITELQKDERNSHVEAIEKEIRESMTQRRSSGPFYPVDLADPMLSNQLSSVGSGRITTTPLHSSISPVPSRIGSQIGSQVGSQIASSLAPQIISPDGQLSQLDQIKCSDQCASSGGNHHQPPVIILPAGPCCGSCNCAANNQIQYHQQDSKNHSSAGDHQWNFNMTDGHSYKSSSAPYPSEHKSQSSGDPGARLISWQSNYSSYRSSNVQPSEMTTELSAAGSLTKSSNNSILVHQKNKKTQTKLRKISASEDSSDERKKYRSMRRPKVENYEMRNIVKQISDKRDDVKREMDMRNIDSNISTANSDSPDEEQNRNRSNSKGKPLYKDKKSDLQATISDEALKKLQTLSNEQENESKNTSKRSSMVQQMKKEIKISDTSRSRTPRISKDDETQRISGSKDFKPIESIPEEERPPSRKSD